MCRMVCSPKGHRCREAAPSSDGRKPIGALPWRRLLIAASVPPTLLLLFIVWSYVGEACYWHRHREFAALVAPARVLSEAVEGFREKHARYPATVDEVRALRLGEGKPLEDLTGSARRIGVELRDVRVPATAAGEDRVLVVISGSEGRIEVLPGRIVRISAGLAGRHFPRQIGPNSWLRIVPDKVQVEQGD